MAPPDEDDDDLDAAGPATLPEAAERRLRSNAFSSGLSVNDFAACLHMGLRPVGLVQGFAVMQWVWRSVYATSAVSGPRTSGYGAYRFRTNTITNYSCPHPYTVSREADHRSWGSNDELLSMETAWEHGFNTARDRMLAEATELGAHGVIGVVDATHPLIDAGIREYHLTGTAVVIDGQPPSANVWSTFLAGQRLAKLLEAGLLPVEVVGTMASVVIRPICITEQRESGRYDRTGIVAPAGEIPQISDAHMASRRVARDRIRKHIGYDSLHGADLWTEESSVGVYKALLSTLKGTRVRRFRDVEPLPTPVPTVRLT